MTSTSDNVAWLTQEAYDRLVAELQHLTGPARSEIAKRIEAARGEGDLSENGGYQAAKEEQGKQEARVRQLQDVLLRAEVGRTGGEDGVVGPGMLVTVRFAGDADTEQFLLGSRELLNLDPSMDTAVYSPQSPLGAAINGRRTGERATYQTPGGRSVDVDIIDAKPWTG